MRSATAALLPLASTGAFAQDADTGYRANAYNAEPTDPDARPNWLPAPDGQFALIIRAHVPGEAILNDSYEFPNVERR